MPGSRWNGLRITGAALLAAAGVVMLGIGLAGLEESGALNGSPAREPAPGEASSTQELLPDDGGDITRELPGPLVSSVTPGLPLDLVPTRVRIPTIGVDSGVVALGTDSENFLEVPEDISIAGWYTGRSVPGEMGPSVFVGHVDSAVAGAGVFYNLIHLQRGDVIEITRSDGSVSLFAVATVALAEKNDFPTDQVYGPTEQPTLRLITCGGSFDRSARSYRSNVIVYAEHLGTRQAVVALG